MLKRVMFSLALVASAAVQADAASEAKVREAIKALVPSAQIDSVAESKLTGFYEVTLGGQVVYVSHDGKYLLSGALWDVPGKKNLTDLRYAEIRKSALSGVGKDKRIVFAAKEPKHTVTVFTDIDCGYCRKLHQQIAEYNNLGITIDYLFFPRSGLNTPSYDKAVTVWCSADKLKAYVRQSVADGVRDALAEGDIQRSIADGVATGMRSVAEDEDLFDLIASRTVGAFRRSATRATGADSLA